MPLQVSDKYPSSKCLAMLQYTRQLTETSCQDFQTMPVALPEPLMVHKPQRLETYQISYPQNLTVLKRWVNFAFLHFSNIQGVSLTVKSTHTSLTRGRMITQISAGLGIPARLWWVDCEDDTWEWNAGNNKSLTWTG